MNMAGMTYALFASNSIVFAVLVSWAVDLRDWEASKKTSKLAETCVPRGETAIVFLGALGPCKKLVTKIVQGSATYVTVFLSAVKRSR